MENRVAQKVPPVGIDSQDFLRAALHPEQGYVLDIAQKQGIPLHGAEHSITTSTCKEKADLLGWALERVVKALYLTDGSESVGIITPEHGRVPFADIVRSALGISARAAARYSPRRSSIPLGMELGTCTPFILESSFGYDIHHLIVVDDSAVEGEMIDVSIGGQGTAAHQKSLHLPYGAIYTILKMKFDGMVKQGRY